MESLYIAGEPGTNSEASLVISFEWSSDLIREDGHPDFNSHVLEIYSHSYPMLHVTLNQVDMKEGSFSRFIRIFEAVRSPEIKLFMNKLIDRNDYVGLI